jgi:predicted  nucleic acid-binding Zn-ribbon protein
MAAGWKARAETAEAEVERLTRECLDRETTETDARERLRRCEERLDKVKAMHRLASDGQHCFTCVMPWHWPCPTASELQ